MHWKIADAWLPRARILHPWPEQRLAALIEQLACERTPRRLGFAPFATAYPLIA